MTAAFALLASFLHAQDSPPLSWRFEPSSGLPNKLLWQTETGRSYDLWESPDLKGWTRVSGYPKKAEGPAMEHAFTPSTKGFFRIDRLEAPPEEFVLIPAGGFQMGDSFSEGWNYELPVHTVQVSAFHMGRYPVTKELWDEVKTWALSNGYSFAGQGNGKAANHPVYHVNWYDAVKWCNARSERDGLTPVYRVGGNVYRTAIDPSVTCNWAAGGYRLPTEAEWEKAARGGLAGKRYPWGDTISHALANYRAASSRAYLGDQSTVGVHPDYSAGDGPCTSPVGSFAPNGYQLYDMTGNVFEWCWDWDGSDYYASSPGTDPRGPSSGLVRINRGGSWISFAERCRIASRFSELPGIGSDILGFRLARNAVPGD